MAEFTDFMNQRVEHFFSMFKELRSGSISYPEIAKRENVRPPINKVCQKLGVKKVAQMTSDEQLLQAIRAVVYDIEMKRKMRTGEEGAKNDGSQVPAQLQPAPAPAPVATSAPPGLSKASPSIASISEAKKIASSTNNLSTAASNAQDSETDEHDEATSNIPVKRLDKLPRAPPALPCDSLDLLKVILAVRASHGRLQKAWQEIQQNPDVSPEVAALSTAYLQNVIKAICSLIGCRRLDIAVSYEETINAFDRYVRHSREGVAAAASAAKSAAAASASAAPVSAPTATPLVAAAPTILPSVPEAIVPHPVETAANTVPSQPSAALSVFTSSPRDMRDKDGSFPKHDSPASSGAASNTFSPRAPHASNGASHSRQNSGMFSVASSAASGGASGASGGTPRAPQGPPRPLAEVYSEFWELAYKLFLYVCNPYRHCQECLCVVEDIVNCLDSTPNLASPLTALALDSVIQRAMYELSDKVSRPIEDGALKALADVKPPAPDCSVRNIELCIALMSRNVSPTCARIRDDYYQRNQLPPPPVGSVWCDKVLTLTRQLQELIAWSSPHCQARVPAFIPAGKFTAPGATRDTLFTDRSLPEHASTTSPRDASQEPNVSDYLSQLSPSAAAEVMAALRDKDVVLSDVLQQISTACVLPQLPPDLGKSLQMTLQKLTRQAVADCSVSQCGAASLGFYDVIGKVKLDFVVLSAPYHVNIHDLAGEDQVQELSRTSGLAEQLRELERAVEMEKLTEIAWKHLKACVRDFHTQSQDFIIKLTSKEGNQESPRNNFNNQGYQGGARRYDAQGGGPGGYHGKYDLQAPQYGSNNGGYAQQPGYSTQAPPPPPELILEIAEDAELVRRIGDGVVDKYQTQRNERISATPVVPQIMQKVEEVQGQVDRPEREKANFIRKFCKSLDRVLKDNRFLYVRVVSNKVRFTHINFEHQVGPQLTVSCNVLACNPLPIQTTRLLFDYVAADRSGKVRDYLQTIKLFAAAHHISDPASGYLSTTAWYVMALHVLLKHGIVPNLHMHRLYHTAERTGQSSPRAAPASWELSPEYQERLRNTPLLVLLDMFFRYYVEQVNIFTGTVTLRDQGTVLPKTRWPGNPVLWRISVEDPFECIGSAKPYDLGCTLSRPGQLTTYKALRRAVYGIHSIMADPAADCRENIKKLFSRVELINLARKSDYMGAVITASPVWVRPTSASVLDTPQYAEYLFTLLQQFDSPEGQQKLALLGEAALGSGSGSPDQPLGKRLGASPQALSAKASTFQPGGLAPATAPMGQNRAPVPQEDLRGAPGGFKPQGGMPANAPPPQYARPGAPQPPHYQQYPGQGPPPGPGPGQQFPGPAGYPGQPPAPRQPYMEGRGYSDYGHPEDFRQQPYQHAPPPPQAQQQRQMFPPHAQQMQGYNNAPPSQYQQNYQREGPYSNQPPPSQAAYAPPAPSQYPGQGQNQSRPQLSQHQPAQYGSADSRDPRDPRSQHPAYNTAPQRNVNPAYPPTGGAPSGPQGGRPFDPAAAALAAAAERRYPINQLQSAQQYDPKNRRPNDPPAGPMQQQQYGRPDLGNGPRNGPPAQRAPEKDRYDATLSARYAPDDRGVQDNQGHLEGRYVPSLALPSGSMTGRPSESQRYVEESHYPSGSSSARYPAAEDRHGAQQKQHAAQASHPAPLDFSVRIPEARNPAPAPRSTGLPQGLKLDLQPRFAEDRYLLSENDPVVEFAAPQTSARQQSLAPSAPAQGTIGKGNLSARRDSDGSVYISPRDASQSNRDSSQQPKKSPVVPLIPLEGISGFSSSSASSSDYGNALHSDRSSVFLGTGRSDILADTGRSTIVPTGGNVSGSLFGVLGTGRSTATNAFGLSAVSMPNTSRSVGDFALHRSLDSADDFRGGLYGGNNGRDDDMAGLSLSSRVADDLLDTGRPSALTEANLADAQPTNRLGYMGLDDLRRGPGVPLATIRSAAPSSNGSQPARSSSEFDLLLERINADSYGGQARRNSSSSGSSNVPYLADFAPPNSARGSSGRGSNASLGHLMEGLDFNHPLISPRQQLTPRREPNMSLLGSIAETPQSPDLLSHKSMNASRALPPGLLSSPDAAISLAASANAAQGSTAYMQQLFNNIPADANGALE